jgi:hypothetical protein
MNRSRIGWRAALALLGLVTASQAGYVNDNFDAAPFTNGTTFTALVQQWQASTSGVAVVNTKYSSSPQSVLVPAGAAVSNTVAASAPSAVWTEFRIAPFLGDAPDPSNLSGRSFVQYFDTDGYLHVWNGSGWLVCSNDVWGQPITLVTNGVFTEVSIYQNFASQRAAVLLNDHVVAQDVPFLGTFADYGGLRLRGAEGDVWLDDVYIQPTYDPVRLTHDRNGDGNVDASELQTYGRVARTLYVGVGQPYLTLAAALAAAHDRDTLNVAGTQYNETVTIAQNVTIAGGSFTNSGTITVAAGKTVTVASNFVSSLIVSGTVALAQGVVVSGAVVTVAGTVTVPANNAQLLAGSLVITGSGTVVSTGGRVVASGLVLSGTFTLDSAWGTQAAARLDFTDDFEIYAADTQVANLGFRGWGASSTDVLVKASQGAGGSQAVVVPAECTVSNRITSAGQAKIWTDFYMRPVWGETPSLVETNSRTFASFVGTNGFLNVWDSGAWAVCSNYVNGSDVTAMDTGSYTRVTVFLNFESHLASVFVSGKLVREKLPFPGGSAVPGYSGFRAQNVDGNLALDDIRITTGLPSGLTADLDGDGIQDAREIQAFDTLNGPQGSVFRFR